MFKKDRKDFENKWDDVKVFIEYGMLTDQTFFQKAVNLKTYKTTKSEYFTLNEFTDKIKDIHKNKDGKTIVLYCNDTKKTEKYQNCK